MAALENNTEGINNIAIGALALASNTTGDDNTAVGNAALFLNTGSQNTATGGSALFNNTTGQNNAAVGYFALQRNTNGAGNTAMGSGALEANTTGGSNTAVGFSALAINSTGDSNTAIGRNAGLNITGSGNVCIGRSVNGDVGVSDTTWIRNVNTLTQNFSAGVNDYVTVRLSDGRLGHTAVVSSRRYKEEIKPLAAASEALYALKPVSFRLKKDYDEAQALGFGLIAEEVEKVDPALVYHNKNGQPESVRYEMVNAMLLNEFLKEHRKVQKLEAALEAVTGRLREQDAKIQKVSAQMEMRNSGSQMLAND